MSKKGLEAKKKDDSIPKIKSKGAFKEKEEEIVKLASKIDETDEMKLRMLGALDRPDEADVLYPPELNAHLIDQLKVMTAENNELRKIVFTRDNEIKELNKTVANLNTRIRDIISGSGPTISSKSAGIISAKISDLCKQNRHLISEVECHKTKTAALERKIMQLELINKEHEKLDVCVCKEEPLGADNVNSDEIKELNVKLAQVNKRLCESKKKNLELKNEIISATKILQQELGDKFTSLKELTSDVMGWKGRAEKIVLLQARISELEEKLKLKEPVDPKRPDQSMIIKDIETKRKKETEQMMKEFKILKEENQDLKKKLEAGRCRVRNLECDATTIRQKMQTYAEKSDADDMLIAEQRNQIKTVELYYQDILRENTAKMNKMTAEIAEYHKHNRNTESKIEALRKQSAEKTAKIDELRGQLQRYEECSLQSVFFTPMRTATDNEIQQLTELVVKLNGRLEAERHKWEELEAAHRKLREKKRRAERKLLQLEEEVKALAEAAKRGSRVSRSSLPKEPQQHMGLASVQSVTKRKSSMANVSEKPSDSSTETPQNAFEEMDKEELKFKLELMEEKLQMYADKVKMLEDEKQEDFNQLTEMISTSKQLFNEALLVLQKEKCLCN